MKGGLLKIKWNVWWAKEQVDNWDNKTKISQGKKYIKIVQDTGVFVLS